MQVLHQRVVLMCRCRYEPEVLLAAAAIAERSDLAAALAAAAPNDDAGLSAALDSLAVGTGPLTRLAGWARAEAARGRRWRRVRELAGPATGNTSLPVKRPWWARRGIGA